MFQCTPQMSVNEKRGHPLLLSASLPLPKQDLPAQERSAALLPRLEALSIPVQNQALRLDVVISVSLIPQCKTTCLSGSSIMLQVFILWFHLELPRWLPPLAAGSMDASCPKDWLAAHLVVLPVSFGCVVFNFFIFPEASLFFKVFAFILIISTSIPLLSL